LVALFKDHFRKKLFYQLLIILAIFDMITILSYGVLYNPYLNKDSCVSTYVFGNMAFDVGNSGSTYTLLAISLERFLTVFLPLIKKRNLMIYIIPISAALLLLLPPRILEAKIYIESGVNSVQLLDWQIYNATVDGDSWSRLAKTLNPFREWSIVNTAILMIIFNVSIIMRPFWKPKSSKHDLQGSVQENTTKILTSAVIVWFLAFFIPYFLQNFVSQFIDTSFFYSARSFWFFGATVNSSANFVIYYLVGDQFRKEVLNIFIPKKCLKMKQEENNTEVLSLPDTSMTV